MNDITAREIAEIERMVGTTTSEPMAFTGAYDGAARFDKQLAGWQPFRESADVEMLPDKELLDARSRDIGRNDAYVQGGGQIHKDSIVGSFYMLNSKPKWRVLGRTEISAEAFQQETEELFTLWAESPMKWLDASRNNDLTEMIRLAVGVYTFAGEALATAEWRRDRGRDFNTCVQMVDTDRLSTPMTREFDPRIRGGVKLDKFGAAVSYFIRVAHESDIRLSFRAGDNIWKEVPARKPWGRQQVIHLREQNRVDQTRAVSDIVAGLREIAITRKFRDVTLQNAVTNAMYAASIESELPPEAVYQQLGGQSNPAEGVVSYATEYLAALSQYSGAAKNLMIDGVRVPHLFPGTKFKLHPAGTPGGVGQDFETSLLRYIATSLGVSYEELAADYSKTNYSSARAAMAKTWRHMQARKKIVADAFANAVFRLWLEEAINKDKLKTFPASEAAILYTDGHLNLMFDALAKADWIGAARGQIDELKETQAAVLRIKYGLSTHEDELARLGKDWRPVYAQLQREAKDRAERGIELYEDNSVNAASGGPRENEDDGTDAKGKESE